MTGDLVERLLARLADLETATAGPWTHDGGVIEAPEKAREIRLHGGATSVERWYVVCDSSTGQAVGESDGAFIAANDPAVVLRTIQAHRALLRMHGSCGSGSGRCDDGGHTLDGEPCAEIDLLESIYFPEERG